MLTQTMNSYRQERSIGRLLLLFLAQLVMIPEFWGREKYFITARVREYHNLHEMVDWLAQGYWLLVEFDDPPERPFHGRKRRLGYVSVSKKIYRRQPEEIVVCCRYSRFFDEKDSVRLRLPR